MPNWRYSHSHWHFGDANVISCPGPHRIFQHINRPAGEAVVVAALLNRIEIALPSAFVFVHSVLKWLHHPLLKNVMLLHAAASSQDFLHASSSDTCFDDAPRYISPAPASHALFLDIPAHVNFPPAGAMRVTTTER